MAAFFKLFAPEVQDMIWNEFLLQESSDRMVILDRFTSRILPVKSLVSPLLSVERNSRRCALRFYDTELMVFKVPSLFYELPPYGVPKPPRDEQFAKTCAAIARSEAEDCKGAVYISPKHDIFITGIPVLQALQIDEGEEIEAEDRRQREHPDQPAIKSRPRYSTLDVTGDHDFCPRIERHLALGVASMYDELQLTPVSPPAPRPLLYGDDLIYSYWQEERFPAIRQFLYSPAFTSTGQYAQCLYTALRERQAGQPMTDRYEVRELLLLLPMVHDGSPAQQMRSKRALVDPADLVDQSNPCVMEVDEHFQLTLNYNVVLPPATPHSRWFEISRAALEDMLEAMLADPSRISNSSDKLN
ncbi:hypothetical protein F4779DRAFT_632944 [Xylariaceae sp. FL0662B]|nr:hypothetical protein F4779DRAFT_632944 [Xylariaceae sp. FL0662B]